MTKGLIRSLGRGSLFDVMVGRMAASVPPSRGVQITIEDSGLFWREASILLTSISSIEGGDGLTAFGGQPHFEFTNPTGGTMTAGWIGYYSLGTSPTTTNDLSGDKSNFGGPIQITDGVQPDVPSPAFTAPEITPANGGDPIQIYLNIALDSTSDIDGDTTFDVSGDYMALVTRSLVRLSGG